MVLHAVVFQNSAVREHNTQRCTRQELATAWGEREGLRALCCRSTHSQTGTGLALFGLAQTQPVMHRIWKKVHTCMWHSLASFW